LHLFGPVRLWLLAAHPSGPAPRSDRPPKKKRAFPQRRFQEVCQRPEAQPLGLRAGAFFSVVSIVAAPLGLYAGVFFSVVSIVAAPLGLYAGAFFSVVSIVAACLGAA
jgi:hypothetical protein